MRFFYPVRILLLVFLWAAATLSGLAQQDAPVLEKPVTISVSDTSIEALLQEMGRQTGVTFSYSSHVVPVEENVSLFVSNQPLGQVLNTLLTQRQLMYSTTGNRVIIRRSKVALTQTIKGVILDQASKAPIPAANILVLNSESSLGVSTDEKGYFRIENVPVGRQSLQISHVGYQTLLVPELLLGAGKEQVVLASLTELVSTIEEVIITDEANLGKPLNEMAAVSTKLLPINEAKRQASSLQDPARIVSAYAGVTGDDYLENSIVIRGNSSRGLLWRLEGVEIPNPNHFAEEGAASGGVSIISANMLADSDFITSAFPARYGNALSGVLDLHLRNGNAEKREYSIQAGTMGLDIGVEGPLLKGTRASYLLNYRYSLFSLLKMAPVAIEARNQATQFQDASFKLSFPTYRIGTFSIFGTGGLSTYAIDSVTTSGQNQSDVGVVGLSHQFQINTSTSVHTVLSLSGTRIGRYRQFLAVQADTASGSLEEDFTKGYARASVSIHKKWNASHLLEAGSTITQLSYKLKDSYQSTPVPSRPFSLFDDQGKAALVQSYVSWRYRAGYKWTFTGGLHGMHFGLTRRTSLEPRAGVIWQLSPRHSLHGGVGVHSRIEPLQYYFARFQLPDQTQIQYNRNLDFTKARHYVAGYDYTPFRDLLLRMEVYYQDLYKVAVRNDSSDIFSTISVYEGFSNYELVNKGNGTNYGIELSVEKRFSRHYYVTWNTSLYKATYHTLEGTRRNTPYNGSFTTHLLVGREFRFGKRQGQHQLTINARTVWNGGKRYIPINLEASVRKNRQVLDISQAYTDRLSNYFRLDLQAAYRLNSKWFTGELRIDILNVTNHQAPLALFYHVQTQQILQQPQLGIYPVVSYRMEF